MKRQDFFLHLPYTYWVLSAIELLIKLLKNPPEGISIKEVIIRDLEPSWGWDIATIEFIEYAIALAERELNFSSMGCE